ncbi:ABC transporter permease [Arthrobacter sp. MMS18-M83]|uniref:ABC transporter permease n=1 Tax=Arthrobacter sp. MMS18-M83 TaxID=2996261 RepID=UPI00227BD1A7|nr:ABC transporter permease [Arthrobacter sp. MMS18-M83]WAH97405.1 ABC transporter permease [Arthrobacter sp. MMS18-M83]
MPARAWRSIGAFTQTRIARLIAVVFLVTFATTLMLSLVPGDLAVLIAGEGAPPEAVAGINEMYGFNDPLIVRYWHWITGLFRGDLGSSYINRQAVLGLIAERAPVTLQLALSAIVVALLVSIPLALIAAYRAGRILDRTLDVVTSIFIAVPNFLACIGLVYVFSVELGVLPVSGWTSFSDDPLGNLSHAMLPTLALSLPVIAVFQRVLRADVIATLQQDFIALARAKGLPTHTILIRHAFRPSAFSLLTVAGLRLAELIGGTVIVETVFAIPGIGSLLVTSILNKDLITVQALVALIALFYLLVNLAVDLTYRHLDPRLGK